MGVKRIGTELNTLWAPTGEEEVEEKIPEWFEATRDERPAGMRVKRGQERRLKKWPIAGPDRRHRPKGRRETDNPNVSVW